MNDHEYKFWLKRRGLSDQTIQQYSFLLKRLEKVTGDMDMLSLDELCLALDKLYPGRNRETGVRSTLIALRRYVECRGSAGHATTDPTAGWIFHRHSSRNLPLAELLSQQELLVLRNRSERYEVLSIRNRVILDFLLNQAMTSYEISRIRIADLDFKEGIVRISDSPRLNRRRLALSGAQVFQLMNYLKEVRPTLIKGTDKGHVVIGKLGMPAQPGLVSYVLEQFKPLFNGRTVTPIRIRQSVIYHWLNTEGLPLERVQLMAGHRDIGSTLRYMSPFSKNEVDAFNLAHPLNYWPEVHQLP